jgi:hypothetical protein
VRSGIGRDGVPSGASPTPGVGGGLTAILFNPASPTPRLVDSFDSSWLLATITQIGTFGLPNPVHSSCGRIQDLTVLSDPPAITRSDADHSESEER